MTEKTGERRFTKAQLMESHRYAEQKDLINALLEDGKTYTLKQVDTQIDKFLKGKVK